MRICKQLFVLGIVASGVAAAACGGSTPTDLFGSGGSDGGGGGGRDSGGLDAMMPDNDSGEGDDAGERPDSSKDDAGKDAGLVVHDLAPPTCNDLPQRGAFVVPSAVNGPAPNVVPLTTLPSGLYVATAITEYETSVTTEPQQKLTVDVTPSRYYYLFETAIPSQRQVYTLDWTLSGGELTRDILCSPGGGGGGGPVKNRVDVAPNGYTLYSTSAMGRPLAIRYKRVP